MASQAITESHLDVRLDGLRQEMNAMKYEVKTDIAHAETRITKWIIGTMLFAGLGSAAIAASITFGAIQLLD